MKEKIMAIDPGTSESAFVLLDSDSYDIESKGKVDNSALLYDILPKVAERGERWT